MAFCNGGCPYNALVGAGGTLAPGARDPHCEAYRRTFEAIGERAMAEVFSPANLEAVIERPDETQGLLRRGKLISIMRDGPHPSEVARQARVIAAAVALAETGEPAAAAQQFVHAGLAVAPGRAEAAMTSLHARLAAPATGMNNCYLHVTFAHPGRRPLLALLRGGGTAQDGHDERGAAGAGDAGGRAGRLPPRRRHRRRAARPPPSQRDARRARGPAGRHQADAHRAPDSLAVPLDDDLVRRLRSSTDELVVSLDGDRETHDARRGPATYDLAVANLRAIAALRVTTELSLAAVLPLAQANGAPGESVRELARELGIRRTRFRPLLPLGRAVQLEFSMSCPRQCGATWTPSRMLAYGFEPTASCGIGENLYVEPDLRAYPCYAWCGEGRLLGSIGGEGGLAAVLEFGGLRRPRLPYGELEPRLPELLSPLPVRGRLPCLGRRRDRVGPRRSPVDCGALHARARSLLVSALDYLDIDQARWLGAGLPLPDSPPGTGRPAPTTEGGTRDGRFGPPDVARLQARKDVPGLVNALRYPKDPGIRRSAAEALGRLDDPRAIEPLTAALLADTDAGVREAVAAMYARTDDARLVEPMIAALGDSTPGCACRLPGSSSGRATAGPSRRSSWRSPMRTSRSGGRHGCPGPAGRACCRAPRRRAAGREHRCHPGRGARARTGHRPAPRGVADGGPRPVLGRPGRGRRHPRHEQ